MGESPENQNALSSSYVEEVDDGTLFFVGERSPKSEKGKFVRIFDDLTAEWGGVAWIEFILDRKHRP